MSYYYLKTFGCQANKAESERQAALFEKQGLKLTANWQQAQEIFLNTCSVRKAADDRAFSLLTKIHTYFQSQPSITRGHLIVAGCLTRDAARLHRMFPLISEIRPGTQIVDFNLPAKRQDKTQAFIQISQGCNSFCTYCVVPYARGREKSRPFAEIITEVKQALAAGYHEITLLGQNVNSWGLEKVTVKQRKLNFNRRNLPANRTQYQNYHGQPPFVHLLQALSQLPALHKIRFLTANPWDFYPELIQEVARNPKIDRYLHLPVQSGSNAVLARMNRGYTREDYLTLVTKLRTLDPQIQIGTDLIVGFPGETAREFQDTVTLAQQVNFPVAFVAMYSARPGTLAEKLYPDDVPFKEKKRRFNYLDQLINKNHLHDRPHIV